METVEEYLTRHAVLDGQGNLDGYFVPLSIAMIAIDLVSQNKLDNKQPSWIENPASSLTHSRKGGEV